MDFEGRYKQLNAAQKEAVDTIDGPVMVLAGPGTGKTELLSMRVANILRRTDTLPENILCLTYTDNGADAMRRRLISIIGKDAYKVAIHTFHSFGSDVMSQHRDYFYRGASFKPADNISTYEILRSIFKELPLSDPLAAKMNDEYSYQSDVKTVISELKKSGLTSAELLVILDNNDVVVEQIEALLAPLFEKTISKKMFDPLARIVSQLKTLPAAPTLYEIPALTSVITDSLEIALDSAMASDSTKPLTAWKGRFFERDGQKQLVLKARAQQKKLRSVAIVYERYMIEMEKNALYDYDDMILQVVHTVEANDELRFNLQEKYQYLLVDEFQDTNLAQMRILHNLTDNPVNEGRPNIFAVGDDDQAIYSFQGADISNILNFQSTYAATKRIVLTENYRSTQEILDSARTIITQGSERLETIEADLSKELSSNTTATGAVKLYELESVTHERQWLASTIRQVIDTGVPADTIAVLIHRHNDIQQLLPFFANQNISVSYERRDNILELEPLQALEQLGRVIVMLSQSRHGDANALFPQLIAHPAWNFSSQDIWKLSSAAYDKRQRWLDAMEAFPAFTQFRSWLIELIADASFTPLEVMIDRLIGTPNNSQEPGVFKSPLYDYYFSSDKLAEDPGTYLTFIEALRILRTRLAEYHANEPATIATFISFIELHRRIGDRIQLTQQIGDASNAVRVMTAHSAKGLEFDHVYIGDVTDRQWGQKARSRSRMISYPANLALAPNDESYDERLRLFYVALTRAKRFLSVSYSTLDESEKPSLPASFLISESWQATTVTGASTLTERADVASIAWQKRLLAPEGDLKKLLLPRLENYRLSATHLNTFIDVSRGGPENFLLTRLLHFPSAMNAHVSYGLAVHSTLEQVHTHFIKEKKQKPIEDILIDFELNLRAYRMEQIDFDAYLQKGTDELSAYIGARQASFSTMQKPELDFKHQQSMLGEVRLSGSLDLAEINTTDKTMTVYDYKTGKPAVTWQGSTENEKIKLYKYRQQLLFYKLLVENSRDYGTYSVSEGFLEFIEPTLSGETISLGLSFDPTEIERFTLLVQKVWEHITTLTLPDTSGYPATLKGLLAFEQDLLDDRV